MKADRVGQVWEVGNRVYLVVSVQEVTDKCVIYDGLILNSRLDTEQGLRNLTEYGEGQWERMSASSTRLA